MARHVIGQKRGGRRILPQSNSNLRRSVMLSTEAAWCIVQKHTSLFHKINALIFIVKADKAIDLNVKTESYSSLHILDYVTFVLSRLHNCLTAGRLKLKFTNPLIVPNALKESRTFETENI
jgi:hypothetical protein